MKKILFLALVLTSVIGFAQINVQSTPNNSIDQQNPFLDASSYNIAGANVGKGIYFPKTDLTAWEFKTAAINPGQFATYFDGFVVYNTATGTTGSNAATQGKSVKVEPGFYYFSNPNQAFPMGNLNNGEWKPLGAAGAKLADYSSVETATGKKWIDDKPVYQKVIAYNQAANSTEIDLSTPIAANTVDKILGFRMIPTTSVGVFSNLKSFDPATSKGIVGSYAGAISTVVPAGDYTIIMEYTKK